MANVIKQVTSLTVDWLDFTGFTFNNKTITLTSAPTVSIFVDYVVLDNIDAPWSTLSTLISKTRANVIKIDPQARMFSDDELATFLNEAQDKIEVDLSDDIPEQQKKVTWNISAWVQEYVLSTVMPWYKKMNSIDLSQCGIDDVSESVWVPMSYTIYGTTLYTDVIPSSSASYVVRYSSSLPTISTYEDCVLPDEYIMALAYYAAQLALHSVEKVEKANYCFQLYTQAVTKLITNNNRRMQANFINYNY